MPPAVILMPAQFTVKVDQQQVECQVSEATLAFDVTSATIKTLCGESDLATSEKGKLTLAGYQDWTAADGLCNFLWNDTARARHVRDSRDRCGRQCGDDVRRYAMPAAPVRPDRRRRGEVLT